MASAVSYGLCQSACNAGAVLCYSAAGYVFGTVTVGIGTPTAILTCNSILGTCMTSCATKFLVEGAVEATVNPLVAPLVFLGGLATTYWYYVK